MAQTRREILARVSMVAGGGLLALAAPACEELGLTLNSSSDELSAAREAFRKGNFGVFQGVYISPDEMRLVAEQLRRDPNSFPDGEAVLDFLIPSKG